METNDRTIKLLTFLEIYNPHLKKEDPELLYNAWKNIVDNLTDEQIKCGCERVKNSTQAFITPQRFRFIAHDLPDPQIAFEQAKDKVYTHRAVYDAARRCQMHSGYNHAGDLQLFNTFRRAYEYSCDKVLNGHVLPPIPDAEEPPEKPKKLNRTTEEIKLAEKYLEEIRNICGVKRRQEGVKS